MYKYVENKTDTHSSFLTRGRFVQNILTITAIDANKCQSVSFRRGVLKDDGINSSRKFRAS